MTSLSPYFQWERSELIRLVPASTRDVLSIGCGGGRTELKLMQDGYNVLGVEMNTEAANEARSHGLEVIKGAAEDVVRDGLGDRRFDCLLFGDVLEHIREPEAVLAGLKPYLRPGGRIIISVPNFRNWRLFFDLGVRGKVFYQDSGIFDYTHVRITSKRLCQGWLCELGFEKIHHSFSISGRSKKLLAKLSLGTLTEFLASQVTLWADLETSHKS